MRNRAQKIRLGVFLFISLVILLSVIGFLTAREYFEKEDIYYVSYEDISVSGLEVGSPVKYMGIKVGTIQDITIDPDNVSKIIVELALKPDTPIKEDAHADITSIGITGLKAIEISGGTNEAEPLEPGSYIPAGSSITQEITGKAEIIAQKAEKVLNNLQLFTQPDNLDKITGMVDKITMLAEQTNQTVIKIDTIVEENRADIRESIAPMKEVSQRLEESSKLLETTMKTIYLKVESDTIDQIMTNFRDVSMKLKETNIKSLIENIAIIADQTQKLLIRVDNDLDRSSQDFSESLHLLRLTLENLNEASRKINNDPSILLRGMETKNPPDQNLNE
ncbi:MAG: MCE family protein [Bacteroidales bacterium]|nr:MCE family protein [Bacteroidales bacterium]